MDRAFRRMITGTVLGSFVVLVTSVTASATKTVAVLVETDQVIYSMEAPVHFECKFVNTGDETLLFGSATYAPPASVWLFENPEGLGRDELLGGQIPIATADLTISPLNIYPGEEYIMWGGNTVQDWLGVPVDPGQYTIIALDGPYPSSWEGVTRDYSGAIADFFIAPEPCTLLVVAGGAWICVLRKRRLCR